MSLVNAETLKKAFWNKATIENKRGNYSIAKGVLYCYDFVAKRVKPVDPVKHRHWIFKESYDENNILEQKYMVCSECDFFWSERNHATVFKYCPQCGAKMDASV